MKNPANVGEKKRGGVIKDKHMPFALSTSWNAFRHDNAKDMLFEIKKLGFRDVELGFNLSPLMVTDAAKLQKKGEVRILSIHNFCPIPRGLKRNIVLPDYYAMSSLDEDERALSLKYTRKTIDTAALLGAKAVVLHCGRVQIPDKTRALIALYEAGLKDTGEFRAQKSSMQKERKVSSGPFFQNTLRSLNILNSYARKKGVRLGIETRFYHREIPSIEEIGIILKEFKGGNLSYWHDTGHAQLMENLGFWRHMQYLDLYGSSMLGIHLHDITKGRDHQAPGKGEFDFRILKKYLNSAVLKILEIHQPATAGDIKEATKYISGLLNG
ncbi:MAG: sugar phosphate isomerase/epimerase [Candidatus Omnitrophota bacterium]